ncbi:General stress protein 26 [Natronincola peptidivorans]|uniref:General stress protein 26 n=1 Tax=Natronincola peptidivorans TaxID=426128 RepID=A0A1I0CJD9_9FIRM|nr:pyridoxamine 5'-phosphate oxidase family protein [Natronincola peptidivorans]SET19284.1 General stress protein 26 [Natronincola peptidivorans]
MTNSNSLENTSKMLSSHKEDVLKSALTLVENCNTVTLGTSGEDGYPNIKAMLKMETEGLKTIWLSTNTSSKRVSQLMKNSKACIYFNDEKSFRGLMLVGDMEVLTDSETRKRLWREGFEIYYPLGVSDPDYSVLKFTSRWGNYYHNLSNTNFEV